MKKLFLTLCFLAMATFAYSGPNITLEWDANIESDLVGYRLYRSNVSGVYEYGIYSSDLVDEITCGPNDVSCCTYTGSYLENSYYVVTAFDVDGDESGPSNEVNTISPANPKSFKRVK